MNRLLKQQQFQWLCSCETDHIEIHEASQLRRQINVRSRVVQKQPGIHEAALALYLARPQTRQQAIRAHQRHSAARQPDSFAVPQAEDAAGEIRMVEDRVEPARGAIARILIARSIEEREPVADPIFIERQFHRRHLRVDVHPLAGKWIQFVVAKHLVERMRDVELAQVAVAGQPVIIRADRVLFDRTDRRRPHQKIILVEPERRVVLVVVKTELDVVPALDKILPVKIRDPHLLVAILQPVQPAVGIFLQHGEVSQIVLIAVRMEVTEDTQSRFLV